MAPTGGLSALDDHGSHYVLDEISKRTFCLSIAAPVPLEQLLSAVLLLCCVSLRSCLCYLTQVLLQRALIAHHHG